MIGFGICYPTIFGQKFACFRSHCHGKILGIVELTPFPFCHKFPKIFGESF